MLICECKCFQYKENYLGPSYIYTIQTKEEDNNKRLEITLNSLTLRLVVAYILLNLYIKISV